MTTLRGNKDMETKTTRGTWELFKAIIPRNITLNQAVVSLIHKEIDKNSRPATDEEIKKFKKPKKKGRPKNRYEVNNDKSKMLSQHFSQ